MPGLTCQTVGIQIGSLSLFCVCLSTGEVPGGVKWVEECLPPDDYEGYAEIKRKIGHLCMVTCGEHEYTRYGFRQLLEGKCCDVIQPDITWCGGITEARRICALAAAYDVPVIPHGSSVYSYHLQAS